MTAISTQEWSRPATLGETPEAWASILGSDFVDDRGEARWRRDYGLVELNFQQTVGIWACVGISVRVHRLITGRAEVVPTPLTRAHGTFPTRLPFETFTARVHQEGLRLKVMEGACGSRPSPLHGTRTGTTRRGDHR